MGGLCLVDVVEVETLASGNKSGGLAVVKGEKTFNATHAATYLIYLTCNDDSMQILQQL